MTTFTAQKKSREILTAKEYLQRRAHDPKSVEGARIVSPKFGRSGFGLFSVERDIPVYEVLSSKN